MNKTLKKAIKRVGAPMVSPAFHVLHFKIGGRHVFLNKYTRRFWPVAKIFGIMEKRIALHGTLVDRGKEYEQWYKKNKPTKSQLDKQRAAAKKFEKQPLISVLVPTYNPEEQFLKECIESVQAQTYENWELCIADDKSPNPQIVKIIKSYAKKDMRIKLVERSENGHICAATNSALEIAKGEYISLLDHDDVLWPNALFEVVSAINEEDPDFIYTDEDKIDETSQKHMDPFFKPGWSPEFIRSINYITHFSTIRLSIVEKVGGFREGYEGAQDWDLFLRVARETQNIHHIPKVVYSWRMSDTSTAKAPSSKDYAYVNQKKALQADIKARGHKAKLDWQIPFSMWKVQYEVKGDPLVSIIIPTKNCFEVLEQCFRSVHEKTSYTNYEIVVVDTGTDDDRVWKLYDEYEEKFENFMVVKKGGKFNFAATCNFGAEKAKGEYFLFLNNDTEVITPTWIEDMVGYAQQEGVGSVGCKLYYPDGRLQHGGVILGVGGQDGTPGIAGHFFPAFHENPPQDPGQSLYDGGTRNFAAVTAAVVMVQKDKFNQIKGFDAKYQIAFNDVDMCLKLYDAGYSNVYLPHVELFHHESISVGKPGEKKRDEGVFAKEIQLMLDSWGELIEDDPFYHPEFRRDIASARLDLKR